MKTNNLINNIVSYTLMTVFSIFMSLAIIATICGDGNKGLFEILQ